MHEHQHSDPIHTVNHSMLSFEELQPLLGRRAVVDVPCPAC